ncbi:hypothetical protein WN48_07990 [Eufriesea mexicana]|nr:hypothetical protein WN48_07990 [Eufriesea mexicana]
MPTWSKDFLLEFIELFRQQEVLWQIRNKNYHNKAKRERPYDTLVEKVKEIDPMADRYKVQKRIINIRTVFQNEYKKYMESCVSGNSDAVYVPKLWYYEKLAFLRDQVEPPSIITYNPANEVHNSVIGNDSDRRPGVPLVCGFCCQSIASDREKDCNVTLQDVIIPAFPLFIFSSVQAAEQLARVT